MNRQQVPQSSDDVGLHDTGHAQGCISTAATRDEPAVRKNLLPYNLRPSLAFPLGLELVAEWCPVRLATDA